MPRHGSVQHGSVTVGVFLAAALLLVAPRPGSASSGGDAGARTPVGTTPHFAFHSDFETNLNDALTAAGEARNDGEPGLFEPGASGPETACFDELPAAERAGWNRAVDYYAEVVSPNGSFSRERMLPRFELAGLGEAPEAAEERRFLEITDAFRAAAAPAYGTCRWEARDAENRRWIEELTGRLAEHEGAIARRLKALYRMDWDALPIPVDVVETVSWSGANTVLDPDHILISTGYEGRAGLEGIFHEATHLLMGRGAPIRNALLDATRQLDVPVEGRAWRDLWHTVQFYVTGEVVRQALAGHGGDSGEPPYRPLLVTGDIYVRYHEPLERTWRPYVDGERTLAEAATGWVRTFDRASRDRSER